jgi:hypothetical protein
MVPPSANSNTPALLSIAPVKAPLLCPNSSLSNSDSAIAEQLIATNLLWRRGPD